MLILPHPTSFFSYTCFIVLLVAGWYSYNDYYEANGVPASVYFRDVNFTDPDVRSQMESYTEQIAAMKYSGADQPSNFWLKDFNKFVETKGIESMSFEEQIQEFLADPVNYDLYGQDMVFNEDGIMTASRTLVRLDNVDPEDVIMSVDVLETQRAISASQPINKGLDDWKFFTFSEDYYICKIFDLFCRAL